MPYANKPWAIVILRANRSIGTGHLMRVKSLLPLLQAKFNLALYAYNFDQALLKNCHNYDEIKLFAEKENILEYLLNQASTPKLVIIDDYAIDESFEKPLFDKGAKIFVIDDLANRKHYCHYLLDQRLIGDASVYAQLINPQCQILIGPQYSLTAPNFYIHNYQENYTSPCSCQAHHNYISNRIIDLLKLKTQVKCNHYPRVFISFGGADPVSACLKITQTILEHKLYQQYKFTLLAGASNSDYPEIKKLIEQELPPNHTYTHHFCLIKHCDDVADLLFKHDIAIGAYGGMMRERIASGIPTIGVIIADNQQGGDYIFSYFNLGVNLELANLNNVNMLKQALKQAQDNANIYTQNSIKIYDGQGLERIKNAIFKLTEP